MKRYPFTTQKWQLRVEFVLWPIVFRSARGKPQTVNQKRCRAMITELFMPTISGNGLEHFWFLILVNRFQIVEFISSEQVRYMPRMCVHESIWIIYIIYMYSYIFYDIFILQLIHCLCSGVFEYLNIFLYFHEIG